MKTPEEILEKLTGESIDTLTKNYVSMPVILTAMKLFAKAYHKEKLKGELIAFAGWITNEYLKQKQ